MSASSPSQFRPAPQSSSASDDADVDAAADPTLILLARPRVSQDSSFDEDESDLDAKPAAQPATVPSKQEPQKQPQPQRPIPALLSTSFDVQINICTYLRATDLSILQRVCRHFHDRSLINAVIRHTATRVYPPDLTEGFDTPAVGGPVHTQTDRHEGGYGPDVLTYEMLRNMEMLVVARVLSRPEPSPAERRSSAAEAEDGGSGGGSYFYVSKSWCRAALRWLEVQQEEQREAAKRRSSVAAASSANSASSNPRNPHASSKKKKQKPTRKDRRQERLRSRKMSDAVPPWQNINHDILCPHGDLARCSSKSARARRRIMDKQAWKVLNRLYPDSVPLSVDGTGASVVQAECVQCLMEQETAKKTQADQREREKEERKRPLSCPTVRGIYTRSKGVPATCLARGVDGDGDSGGDNLDRKPSAFATGTPASTCTPGKPTTQQRQCPLVPGVYDALPRSWCHRWRKFLKTGEGERPVASDATALLLSLIHI